MSAVKTFIASEFRQNKIVEFGCFFMIGMGSKPFFQFDRLNKKQDLFRKKLNALLSDCLPLHVVRCDRINCDFLIE
tara:strand:+ start:393 stop:620 length:228 start_codon:yes stop_codon:yes gene_type:complete